MKILCAFLLLVLTGCAVNFDRLCDNTVIVMNTEGHGTGFAVDSNTIVTAKHVAQEPNLVVIFDEQVYVIKDTHLNPYYDIATIELQEALPIDGLPLGEANLGDQVFVVGCPITPGMGIILQEGIISAVWPQRNEYVLGVTLSPGNSGSPVINEHGQVIGIATAIYRGQQQTGLNKVVMIGALGL
jgi:S1-C subfamily serine protease